MFYIKEPKSLLITGASGFVGTNLVLFIQDKIEVDITSASRKKNINKIFTLSYKNILSETTRNFQVYIHLAGKAHDLRNSTEESEYFEVNYELTKRLFDRFLRDEKAQMFIFISSVKAVAEEVQGELTEGHKPNPVSAYGRSKLKAENYVLSNLPKNKKVIILRPCMIHGPGNQGNLNLLYRVVRKGIPWPLGAFNNSRSFLSIENLCFVIKEALEEKINSGVYNIADDTPLSTNELISIISEVRNKTPRIWSVSKGLIHMVAKIGNVLSLPLNEERLEKLTKNYLVSNEKIKKALGIEQMPVSAREGMFRTIESFEQ